MESGKNFCNFLTNGLFITDKVVSTKSLSIKPCCWFKESSSLLEYNQAREKWKSIDTWTENCSNCFVLENKKKDSYRNTNELNYDSNGNITVLEIDYSNFCNAACGICGPENSNLIGKYMRREGINDIPSPHVSQKDFIDAIDQLDLSYVNTVRFKGGEALIQKFHLKVLEKLKNKNVVIEYLTNSSNYPDDETWTAWKDYNIKLLLSIDGIGKKFEYIRTPLVWNQVQDNINLILSNNKANITCELNYTINPLNLYYHDEMFQLFLKLRKNKKLTNIRMHQCFDDWGLENTTPELRKLFKSKYTSDFSISQMLDQLPFEDWKYERFLKAIKKHEKRFNLNGAEVFPEIWDLAIKNKNL